MRKDETWNLVSPPHNVKPISCKWALKVKQKADGLVDQWKVRFSAQWFLQKAELTLMKCFSPLSRITFLCKSIVLATSKEWQLLQMDVKNVFLCGKIDKEIFMA